MLRELRVGNLALAADVAVRLDAGLTMITGETGAGKSLVAGALSLLGGGRVEKRLVRDGEDEAFVEGVFDLAEDAAAAARCAELGVRLDGDGMLVLRREIRREGRGRTLINGLLSSQSLLEELAPALLAVQSQDQQRALARSSFAREFLDGVLGLEPRVRAVASALQQLREAERRLARRRQEADLAREQLDMWRYQHDEIKAADPDPDDEARLRERLGVGRNARALVTAAGRARDGLSEGDVTALQLIGAALSALEPLAGASTRMERILGLLRDAEAGVGEAAAQLEGFLDGIECDESALDEMEERLSLYQELQRKYRRDTAGLAALQEELGERIRRQDAADTDLDELHAEVERLRGELARRASELGEARRAGAAATAARAVALIRPLALPDLELELRVEADADADGEAEVDGVRCRVAAHGADRVRLLARTNRGEALGEVAQIASGGERSRIWLGLSVLAGEGGLRPLLLFDEIDAGLGMDNAVPVAELLARLAEDRQVLCITHLATVAVKGRQHLQVKKSRAEGRTVVAVRPLAGDERIGEVVRLLGGAAAAGTTPADYARQLLAEA